MIIAAILRIHCNRAGRMAPVSRGKKEELTLFGGAAKRSVTHRGERETFPTPEN